MFAYKTNYAQGLRVYNVLHVHDGSNMSAGANASLIMNTMMKFEYTSIYCNSMCYECCELVY